jgi:hypothetical protein
VKLVISDAHTGLKAAIARVFEATWQRCRVGLLKNSLVRCHHAAGGEFWASGVLGADPANGCARTVDERPRAPTSAPEGRWRAA